MPPSLSKPSSAAPAALIYITLGALLTVWSGIWFMYLRNHPPGNQVVHYFCMGLLGTGIVLLLIGFTLGPISRWRGTRASADRRGLTSDGAGDRTVGSRF